MPATQRVDQRDRKAIDPMNALRGFFHIMDAWGVSADDARVLLGSPAERTYYAWRQGNAVCRWIPFEELATSPESTRLCKSSTRTPIWPTAGSNARTERLAGRALSIA